MKPTVSFTPPCPQYLLVSSARRPAGRISSVCSCTMGVPVNAVIDSVRNFRTIALDGGALAGLILMAVFEDSTSISSGRRTGTHAMKLPGCLGADFLSEGF